MIGLYPDTFNPNTSQPVYTAVLNEQTELFRANNGRVNFEVKNPIIDPYNAYITHELTPIMPI
jgi:hypothetical protein